MSQIDLLNFIPHLFWFIIIWSCFYFLVFSAFLPMIFESLKLRYLLFSNLYINTYHAFYFDNLIFVISNFKLSLSRIFFFFKKKIVSLKNI